jgi:hypothetical protein
MIRGEQAAVMAYRWQDRVVVQYVVSEALFFRQPVVRDSVTAAGRFTAEDGSRSVVAWPNPGAGSLIISDLPVNELERLTL